jgi:S-adenosylmethionine:tRNA ribosyltransferase-isomerase
LEELRRRDVRIARLTLHVGLGTFSPVAVDDLDEHPMHAEWFDVSDELAGEIRDARSRGAPVVAVGTTVVRALEAAANAEESGLVRPTKGETRILIQPGYKFRVVDSLLTNFHLPKSTLLALVSAFAGREQILGAYREAVSRGYRFFSYGDAMWIARREGAP